MLKIPVQIYFLTTQYFLIETYAGIQLLRHILSIISTSAVETHSVDNFHNVRYVVRIPVHQNLILTFWIRKLWWLRFLHLPLVNLQRQSKCQTSVRCHLFQSILQNLSPLFRFFELILPVSFPNATIVLRPTFFESRS